MTDSINRVIARYEAIQKNFYYLYSYFMKTISIQNLYWLSQYEILDAVFLYPTDSLYGLGAIVNQTNIHRINTIKQRSPNKNYSIITPSIERTIEHFQITRDAFAQKYTERSQQFGPITILCKKKQEGFLSWVSSNEYIGIRWLENHPIQARITFINQPFLSTSANISWEVYDPSKFDQIFGDKVNYKIAENNLSLTWSWSAIIYYDTGERIR